MAQEIFKFLNVNKAVKTSSSTNKVLHKDKYVVSHGVMCYKIRHYEASRIEVLNAIDNIWHNEVCASNKRIGIMGFDLIGEITAEFEADCWSQYDPDTGTRFNDWGAIETGTGSWDYYIDPHIKESDVTSSKDREIYIGHFESYNQHPYNEVWIKNSTPVRVWVATNAPHWVKIMAQFVSKKMDIPLLTVHRSARWVNQITHEHFDYIWDNSAPGKAISDSDDIEQPCSFYDLAILCKNLKWVHLVEDAMRRKYRRNVHLNYYSIMEWAQCCDNILFPKSD